MSKIIINPDRLARRICSEAMRFNNLREIKPNAKFDNPATPCNPSKTPRALSVGSATVEEIQIGGQKSARGRACENHYKNFKIQPAEFCQVNGIGFLEGCVIKRMCRHGSKNKIEDLRKAMHEIQLLAKYAYGVDNLMPL